MVINLQPELAVKEDKKIIKWEKSRATERKRVGEEQDFAIKVTYATA